MRFPTLQEPVRLALIGAGNRSQKKGIQIAYDCNLQHRPSDNQNQFRCHYAVKYKACHQKQENIGRNSNYQNPDVSDLRRCNQRNLRETQHNSDYTKNCRAQKENRACCTSDLTNVFLR